MGSGIFRRRQWHPTPVLLPGKSHGWRSLVGCSPWGREGRTRLSDFTFTFHFHALEKDMATHSGVLAWRIPGTGKPGGLPSMGSHRVGHNWSDLAAAVRQQWHFLNFLRWFFQLCSKPYETLSVKSLFLIKCLGNAAWTGTSYAFHHKFSGATSCFAKNIILNSLFSDEAQLLT